MEITKDVGEDMFEAFLGFDLKTLVEQMEEIAGQWNGDNPGIAEDRAHCALEIKQTAEKLKELLDELATY